MFNGISREQKKFKRFWSSKTRKIIKNFNYQVKTINIKKKKKNENKLWFVGVIIYDKKKF